MLQRRFPYRFGFATWLILIIQFIAFFTFFLFVPFISTYFSKSVGFSVSFVGVILAIRIMSQQGLMVVGGFLADRLGYKPVALCGFLLRGLGFIGMGLATNPSLVLLAAGLSGLGGAMFSPALRASLTSFTPSEQHKDAFSLLNVIENTGTVLGPLAGLYFQTEQFLLLSIFSGVLFGLMSVLVLFLPDHTVLKKQDSWIRESTKIFRHKSFLFVTLSLMPFHFLYQQLYLTLPIAANQATGSSGWIFSFVTILVVFFQWPISRFSNNKSLKRIFILSYVVLFLAHMPIVFGISVWTIALILGGLSFGSMMLLPAFQSYVAHIAPKESLAAYFGFSNMAMAIGGSLGNLFGGMLHDYFVRLHKPEFFWILLSVLTIAPIAGAVRLKYIQQKQRNARLWTKIRLNRSGN
ncbi:MFS transporter [Shimazuella kribbensis]|uniref:MFS transporter n=1 Tax=Shimazuella kribbensis TaxID=139808 RepID=UPI00048DDAB4|nr:MFS transporter [Shimazuella kribbensis]